MGDIQPPDVNEAANRRLQSELEARGRRWAQLAVFYVTDAEVAVLESAGAFRDARRRGLGGQEEISPR